MQIIREITIRKHALHMPPVGSDSGRAGSHHVLCGTKEVAFAMLTYDV